MSFMLTKIFLSLYNFWQVNKPLTNLPKYLIGLSMKNWSTCETHDESVDYFLVWSKQTKLLVSVADCVILHA